jgi:formylglycine-generating enzyme required for sulfatase activity
MTKVVLEKDFVSERLWAEVMGEPTEGLSSRWAKTGITAEEAEEFCRRRTEQERREHDDAFVESLGHATGWSSGTPPTYRLPTEEEWVADFEKAPYQHFIYGWTATVHPGGSVRVGRGGCWLDGNAGILRSSVRFRFWPVGRFGDLGLRCAKEDK